MQVRGASKIAHESTTIDGCVWPCTGNAMDNAAGQLTTRRLSKDGWNFLSLGGPTRRWHVFSFVKNTLLSGKVAQRRRAPSRGPMHGTMRKRFNCIPPARQVASPHRCLFPSRIRIDNLSDRWFRDPVKIRCVVMPPPKLLSVSP